MRLCLIGAGNVATHLGQAFYAGSHTITQVFSRSIEHAGALATRLKAMPVNQLSAVSGKADVYFLLVPDDAIEPVARKVADQIPDKALLVHSSGNTPDAVVQMHPNSGVFYPLQSFSKDRIPDFRSIPVLISANTESNISTLHLLAASISDEVYEMDEEDRRLIHLAAVMVNNFTNHLYHMAHRLLQTRDIPFKVLLPLIMHTAEKVRDLPPGDAQTGPALRGDIGTIRQHLELLKDHQELKTLYLLLSKGINPDLEI